MTQSNPAFSVLGILAAAHFQALEIAYADDTNVVQLDTSLTSLVFEGIGALSAGASSRLLIDYPKFTVTEPAKNSRKRLWASEDGPWSGKWGVT